MTVNIFHAAFESNRSTSRSVCGRLTRVLSCLLLAVAAPTVMAQAGAWLATGTTTSRAYVTGNLLANGKVLVEGGAATAELYDPVAGTWSLTGSPAVARTDHTATLLPSGKVLVVGGRTGSPASVNTSE